MSVICPYCTVATNGEHEAGCPNGKPMYPAPGQPRVMYPLYVIDTEKQTITRSTTLRLTCRYKQRPCPRGYHGPSTRCYDQEGRYARCAWLKSR